MITDNPDHPDIRRGQADTAPVPQNAAYLVLPAAERAKGFVRPVRSAYRHVGISGPTYPLRELYLHEHEDYDRFGYVSFEAYPGDGTVRGKYWTQAELDAIGKGCGATTTMGRELSETYARNPHFYGATYCVGCRMHRPVGERGEFVWEDGQRVGT